MPTSATGPVTSEIPTPTCSDADDLSVRAGETVRAGEAATAWFVDRAASAGAAAAPASTVRRVICTSVLSGGLTRVGQPSRSVARVTRDRKGCRRPTLRLLWPPPRTSSPGS